MEKSIQLLKELRKYVNDSSGFGVTTAAYIPPSLQMRIAADEMDRKDALLREIDLFIKENETL